MDLIRAFSERFNELIVYAGTSPKKMSAELKHNIPRHISLEIGNGKIYAFSQKHNQAGGLFQLLD